MTATDPEHDPTQQRKAGYCALCRSRCGTINLLEDGRFVGVEPAADHPTGGALCRKGRAAPEMVYNPRRLLHPLRRTKPKDSEDPGWVRISWDEALDEIAQRARAISADSGPEAIAFGVTTPAGTAMSDSIEWVERFIRKLGSPNICYATEICKWHQDYAHKFTFGVGIPTPDFKHSDLIILWGYNPSRSWLSQASRISDAQRRGARVMVVDPRRTGHAQHADHWLAVRPGSDGILALALAHVLIESKKYDEEFVRSWTNAPFLVREDTGAFLRASEVERTEGEVEGYLGWCTRLGGPARIMPDVAPNLASQALSLRGRFFVGTTMGVVACRPAFDLYAEACAHFAPERAEKLTWVPATQIREAANAIAAAEQVSYYAWTGVGQSVTATQTERAIALLYALTGCFDAAGGNVCFTKLPANRVNDLTLLSTKQRDKALGYAQRPLGPPSQGWITAADLYTSILDGTPYRTRLLFAFGGNMLVTQADPQRGREALESCEFHVHCDLVQTPTSQFADIVLPVATPWEREALRVGFDIDELGEEVVQFRQKVIEPLGEARSDTWIVFELAKRLGLSDEFFGGDIEAGWNHVLQPLGLTVEILRTRPNGVRIPLQHSYKKYAEPSATGIRGFATQTKRVEIYSEVLLRNRYEPVPRFAEMEHELTCEREAEEYPLILTSAKNGYFCHAEHRGIASLRKRSLDPIVEMNPALAQSHDVSEDDWVSVETEAGKARFKAKLNPDLHPRVIVGEYGWWQPCEDLGLPGYDPFAQDGSNLNNVISARRGDPISGSVPHRSFPCRVVRVFATHGRSWTGSLPFEVAALTTQRASVTTVELRPVEARGLPNYRPGQHLTIEFPGDQVRPTAVRAYSLCDAASQTDRSSYRITVKDVANPDLAARAFSVSAHINQNLRVGDVVRVRAPSGKFLLPVNADLPVVLVAAGIGITPFKSYLETVAAGGTFRAPIHLYYGNRNSRSHVFRERLQEISKMYPIRVTNFYSQPLAEDRIGAYFDVHGRITAQSIDSALIQSRARFYVCGPEKMIDGMIKGLCRRGVPRFDIFYEVFSTPQAVSPSDLKVSYRVRFSRSGQEVVWTPAAGTLLECAEAAGVSLRSGCRVGQCESCAMNVVSGAVSHLNRPDLEGEDYCLTCQAVPISDLFLED